MERALNEELAGTPEISTGARGHLRETAHALDLAAAQSNPNALAKASVAYLEVRRAYGLAGGTAEPLDPFAAFVAGLSTPSVGHTTDP